VLRHRIYRQYGGHGDDSYCVADTVTVLGGRDLPLSRWARSTRRSVERAAELGHAVGERWILGGKIEETTRSREVVIGRGGCGRRECGDMLLPRIQTS